MNGGVQGKQCVLRLFPNGKAWEIKGKEGVRAKMDFGPGSKVGAKFFLTIHWSFHAARG